jgi:hypothetical protein
MEEEFDDWFYEMEGFVFRAERFWDDVELLKKPEILEWMRTAFKMGYNAGQQLYGGTE